MDSERPIEKLLRDAGRKQASERSVELHPATRRMLQAEVARQYAKPGDGRRSAPVANMLFPWWSRIGWSFGVLLGLAAAALLMVPREKRTQEMTLAQAKPATELNEHDRGGSPRLAGSTTSVDKQQISRSDSPAALSTSPAPPQLSDSSKLTFAEGTTRKAESEPAGRATEAPALNQPAAAFGGQLASRETRSYATSPASQTINSTLETSRAAAPPAASAPAAPAPAAPAAVVAHSDTFYFSGTATPADDEVTLGLSSQRFKRELTTDEKTKAAKNASRPPLLTSFAFELNGNQVRVIDADGSVYSGAIERQTTADVDQLKEAAVSKSKNLALNGRETRAESPPTGTMESKRSPLPAGYGFHVMGTNRSLSAKIDFSGALTGITNITNALALADNKDSVSGLRPERGAIGGSTNVHTMNLQQAQISGKAVVGDKQLLDVKATATNR